MHPTANSAAPIRKTWMPDASCARRVMPGVRCQWKFVKQEGTAMSDTQEMERFFRERGFGQLIGWGDSPALLVIDLTRAFTAPALPRAQT
jgi:hypothetical protein